MSQLQGEFVGCAVLLAYGFGLVIGVLIGLGAS